MGRNQKKNNIVHQHKSGKKEPNLLGGSVVQEHTAPKKTDSIQEKKKPLPKKRHNPFTYRSRRSVCAGSMAAATSRAAPAFFARAFLHAWSSSCGTNASLSMHHFQPKKK